MTVIDLIAVAGGRLSPGERRVAETLVADPSRVAFGTVASIAELSGVSGPTVLRLAAKLGFDGFAALQSSVQDELARQLRPAAERIRAERATDALGRTLAAEVANLVHSFERVDRKTFDRAAALLADANRKVWVLAGEATSGIASTVAGNLDLLRDGVGVVGGSPVAVARSLSRVERGDVVLAFEVRRYERWVLDALDAVRAVGASIVVVTDSPVSPLADGAKATFVVDAAGAGPFDSHVATLAVAGALVADVASRLRRSATSRLDVVEAATADLLLD